MDRRFQGVVVGDVTGMEAVAGVLLGLCRQVQSWPTIPDLLRGTDVLCEESQAPPDLILVCQHWSDEYSRAEISALLEAFPLARTVCCYGPWCASDGRTRSAWPAAVRVPVGQGVDRIRKEAEILRGQRAPLPLTAGLDELFGFNQPD